MDSHAIRDPRPQEPKSKSPLSPDTNLCKHTSNTPNYRSGTSKSTTPTSFNPHPDLVPLTPPRAFNFGEFLNHKAQQPLPPSIASHESQISAFRDHCYHLTLKLNTLLGIGLQVTPPDFFTKARTPPSAPPPPPLSHPTYLTPPDLRATGPSGTTLRLLHYPPSPSPPPQDTLRAGAHSDYGSLTLLFRLPSRDPTQPDGLEILTPTGTWEPVPVCPSGSTEVPPILVNVGDLLSYWTGGLLRSTVHRVVFPEEGAGGGERYSMAYFCHPAGGVELGAVPSERVRREGKGGEVSVMTADEHLQMRYVAFPFGFLIGGGGRWTGGMC